MVLGDSLPLDELDKFYLRRLNNDACGVKNKPSSMIIGALFVKQTNPV